MKNATNFTRRGWPCNNLNLSKITPVVIVKGSLLIRELKQEREEEKMFNVTKYENDIVVDNYMIHNVDNVIELAKILDKRHNSTKTLACNVYFGSISSGGAGHKIVLAYNNNSKITID